MSVSETVVVEKPRPEPAPKPDSDQVKVIFFLKRLAGAKPLVGALHQAGRVFERVNGWELQGEPKVEVA